MVFALPDWFRQRAQSQNVVIFLHSVATLRQAVVTGDYHRDVLISVVIPVHGVAEHLGACLDSVLGQPEACVEVIAVDDASPDGCGAILDGRARRDPRLRVVHLGASAGPGQARRTGAGAATGEYVWFVDGDDMLADGALAEVSQRLERLRPDVLVIGYEDAYPPGGSGHRGRPHLPPGQPSRGAGPDEPQVFTLAERPALIRMTMTSWSKVLRRAFLCELGVPFGPGIHEDVPVSCAALLAARRISVLDQVCYRYRRERRGSFMATVSARHFDIFASYEWVFRFLDGQEGPVPASLRPACAAVRAAVFERAIWHYTTLLGLVPRADRREFFRRMSRDFRRYRPEGYTPPAGARGMKFRLVERDAYWAYTALEPLNGLRVALRASLGAP
jgi:CDP-glycerol glycerophosphotransferase